MFLTVAGVSHRTAPLEVREDLALGQPQATEVLRRLRSVFPEAVVLSTCNRTELYVVVQDTPDPASIFRTAFPDTEEGYRPYLFALNGEEAARHLFHVASGLDSVVLGEAEVLGQVRRAWDLAHDSESTGAVTSRLFHEALATGKRARTQTDIGKFSASLSSAATVLARRVFGRDIGESTALVIGAGQVGQGVARSLHENGVSRMLVGNRRKERAEEMAHKYGAAVVPWPISTSDLARADIVISCTAASGTVLTLQDVSAAIARRPGEPIHLIDLAIPRDIDPLAADIPQVTLHNLDDVQGVVEGSIQKRRRSQPQVEAIVEEQVARFAQWLRERRASSSVRRLRQKGEAIRRSELDWALPKLQHLSEGDRRVIDQLTSRLLNKLLHAPTTNLREVIAAENGKDSRPLVDLLFDLDHEPSSTVAGERTTRISEDNDSE